MSCLTQPPTNSWLKYRRDANMDIVDNDQKNLLLEREMETLVLAMNNKHSCEGNWW